MQRIGIFGGAFDPIHVGHLILAQDVWDNVELDKIIFLVNFKPPHKEVFAPFEDRYNMVKRALEGNGNFEASDFERRIKIEPSYTVNVLSELSKVNPDWDFYLIIGWDQYSSLSSWYRPDLLLSMVKLIVLKRPGWQVASKLTAEAIFVDERLVDISSTEVRDKVRKGKSIKYLVPPAVENYIFEKGLYK